MWRRRMRRTEGRKDGRTEGRYRLTVLPSYRPSVWSTLKQLVGMPDYARYLEQSRSEAPDCPLLNEREFYDRYLAERYGGGGVRCC